MKRCALALLPFLLLAPASAEETLDPPQLEVHLQLLKQVYRVNEPLEARLSIENTGAVPLTIRLSEHLFHNFAFRVRSLDGLEVKWRDDFQLQVRARRSLAPPTRPVLLLPGERFGRTVDVAGWFRLVEPGTYEISSLFFPRPRRTDADRGLASNGLRFVLRPPEAVRLEAKRLANERRHALGRAMAPGETVEFMLKSRLAQDWTGFFKYMDLPRLIRDFVRYAKRWDDAVEDEKRVVLDDFQEYLKIFPSERIERFFVKKVAIDRDERTMGEQAVVETQISYREKFVTGRKLYIFRLYKRYDNWFIYSYDVVNRDGG